MKKLNVLNLIKEEIYEGKTIEERIELAMLQEEPIEDSAPIVYTERKDGVLPQYDIRTDRWEIAQRGMEKVAENRAAKIEEKINGSENGNGSGNGSENESVE